MPRRHPQAQVALIAALVFLLVAFALVAVLVAGVADGGVSTTAPLMVGALALGGFALAARLFLISRPANEKPSQPENLAADPVADVPSQARETGRLPRPRPRRRPEGL